MSNTGHQGDRQHLPDSPACFAAARCRTARETSSFTRLSQLQTSWSRMPVVALNRYSLSIADLLLELAECDSQIEAYTQH